MRYLIGLLAMMLATTAYADPQYPGYPPTSVPVGIASLDTANGQVQITLPAVAGWRNYLAFMQCSGDGATASISVDNTITGLLGGTVHFAALIPAKSADANWRIGATISPAWPATAANTAIMVTVPALGAGNTHSSCSMLGFRIPE